MWTLGYNDAGEFSFPEPFNGRKLRPLIPRPMPSSLSSNGSNFCANYYHLASLLNEQSKRELNGGPPAVVVSSSRWSPTPEQLRILEELYRRGTRTPSADQIQHITAQLRRYGKIEGKNVFYWFQNHKARERQKRRRQTAESPVADDRPQDIKPLKYKDSEAAAAAAAAAGRSVRYEIEETKKNWAHSTNCTTSLAEEVIKTQRMAKVGSAAPAAAEEETSQQQQQQQRRDSVDRNATWHSLSQLINPRRKKTTTTSTMKTAIVEPYRSESSKVDRHSRDVPNSNDEDEDEDGCDESQTLQLFPLRSTRSCRCNSADGNGFERSVSNMKSSASATPDLQFFEFLPPKTN